MKKSMGPKTLIYPLPVWVIGTYGQDGRPNVMTAGAGMLSCKKPPCVAIALREATYTYRNILERRAFTVNIPSEAYLKEADYFGIATGRKEDKFNATGLTPVRSALVDAPYVQEFPVILECKVIHSLEIGSHTLFVGEILDAKADGAVLGDNGLPQIAQVQPVIYDVANAVYYGLGGYLGKAYDVGRNLVPGAAAMRKT